jgi:hypothetical protein
LTIAVLVVLFLATFLRLGLSRLVALLALSMLSGLAGLAALLTFLLHIVSHKAFPPEKAPDFQRL